MQSAIHVFTTDVCTDCATVAGALSSATYTCTSAADSRVSACAVGKFQTVGGTGATDVCTNCATVAVLNCC